MKSSYVQALTAPLKSIHVNDSIEQAAVREAEAEINQAFEELLGGFRQHVLTVLMRTTQTILRHRLQVSTTAPTKPRVVVKPAVPTMIAVAPTAVPALAAVNGGWRKQRPAQPKPAKEPKPRAASADEKLQLQSLLIMIRSAMNWSQEELAVRLGVNYQTTGTWERGRSYPAPPMYDKIVALGKETGVLPK